MSPGDAQRLSNGNTLISCGTQKRVIEVTPGKQIAWQFTAADGNTPAATAGTAACH